VTDILRDVASLRDRVSGWKAAGAVVGVVPTMGALHEGHLDLVRAAVAECGHVIVTIFVNPRQFDRPEDLASYPRTEAADAALLRPLGVDLVFAPPPVEVYPPGFVTTVTLGGAASQLEGAHRPGHFDGMATVVAKLFLMTGADRAYFGEKDWQQLQLVRRLAADLNIPVTVVGCPTSRDPDGLARSSRNLRLPEAARAAAPALQQAMVQAAAAIRVGAPVAAVLGTAQAQVLAAGFDRVDYIALCHAETLEPLQAHAAPARLLAAAWIGGVRLIDNIAV
jgi:pantoate--beta-alanine ligase